MSAESKLGYKSIWLDLFCISQQMFIPTDPEIARQANIFRSPCKESPRWLILSLQILRKQEVALPSGYPLVIHLPRVLI